MSKFGICTVRCICLVVLIFFVTSPAWADQTATIEVGMVIKVDDRDRAADLLVSHAKAVGGYFTQKSRERVVLKIPALKLTSLLPEVVRLGRVIDRKFVRRDSSGIMIEYEAALKAKSEMQQHYLALIDEADTKAILTVEKELVQLVAEIENLRGKIRFLRHRIQFAELEVSFQFRDRKAPIPDGSSSFAWLNTMNLTDLLEAF